MLVVLRKWIAHGNVEYKIPSEYLLDTTSTDEEKAWGKIAFEYGAHVRSTSYLLNFNILSDPNSNNKITVTYYTSQYDFNILDIEPEHATFISARNTFLEYANIELIAKSVEVDDISLTAFTYEQADSYMSSLPN